MIILTGATGFIGSCFVNYLIDQNVGENILAVDTLGDKDKWKNISSCSNIVDILHPNDPAFSKIDAIIDHFRASAVVHLGAITSTTETDADKLWKTNYVLPRKLSKACAVKGSRFVYSSSAATYGATDDFDPSAANVPYLRALNAYGWSKNQFDLWCVRNKAFTEDANVACVKPFNVYGPNELHKGNQMSIITKILRDYVKTGATRINLFDSNVDGIDKGEEQRDFVYVKDVCEVLLWLLNDGLEAYGIFNVGTGTARSFNSIANAMNVATGKGFTNNYIDMPEDIKDSYQYYTQADLGSLRNAGYDKEFMTLEAGVKDYFENYWKQNGGYWR